MFTRARNIAAKGSVILAMVVGTTVAQERLPGAVVDPMTDAFEWSATRPLTWADFQGKPDLMSGATALSAYVISYNAPARCLCRASSPGSCRSSRG